MTGGTTQPMGGQICVTQIGGMALYPLSNVLGVNDPPQAYILGTPTRNLELKEPLGWEAKRHQRTIR